MKETGTKAIFQFPAKDKRVWEPIMDTAQALCKNKGLFCGICIGWKEVWTFGGKESTVFMTIATIAHPATDLDKNHLAEVAKKIAGLVASAA